MGTKAQKTKEQQEAEALERELRGDPPAQTLSGYAETQPSDLPDEDELFADAPEEVDAQRFVKLANIGEKFTGKYIRPIDPKSIDQGRAKHPGYLFAEYPSGMLKVLPANWSIGEKIAEKEREDPQYFDKHIVRFEVADIVNRPDGSSVKLFGFRPAPIPPTFRVRWDKQFPAPTK